jgi:hypothetical protein
LHSHRLVVESDEVVRILGKIVHTALARRASREQAKLRR